MTNYAKCNFASDFRGFATLNVESDTPDKSFCCPGGLPMCKVNGRYPTAWINQDQRVNPAERPTLWVLDLGCTRSMGSREACKAFEKEADRLGIKVIWKRCKTVMTFANSAQAVLEWCMDCLLYTSDAADD